MEPRPQLAVLDLELGKQPFLAGDRFSVADLNVGCVMLRPHEHPDLASLPNLRRWDQAVFGRPAAQKASAIRVAAARA